MNAPDPLASLNRLFIEALLHIGDAGDIDGACRLAARGWSLLRHDQPDEAQRLNAAMHNLTNPRRRSREQPRTGNGVEPV